MRPAVGVDPNRGGLEGFGLRSNSQRHDPELGEIKGPGERILKVWIIPTPLTPLTTLSPLTPLTPLTHNGVASSS